MDPDDDRPFDAARAFAAHGGVLLGFAVNALRDRAAAEDCVQETFLRAYRARDRYDPVRAGERGWLFAILRNVIVDRHRIAARAPLLADDGLDEQLPAVTADPLARLGLVEALARLSDEHREVVVAVHVRGMSYAELSAVNGVPVGTLRTRCFAALRVLRSGLEDGDGRRP